MATAAGAAAMSRLKGSEGEAADGELEMAGDAAKMQMVSALNVDYGCQLWFSF